MGTYPYDWKGTNPANAFTEDRIVSADNQADRVVVLKHRPFFGTSLVVTVAGSTTPLVRGVDFELVYQLTELDDSVASPVFCGIELTNPLVSGTLTFKGQVLGDSFYSPFVDILDELVKYLNNPEEGDWLNTENRPTLYPTMPSATSWADLLNKKYLASAVADIELASGNANDVLKAKLESLRLTVTALQAEVTAFNYPAHIADHKAHGITLAQSGAHPVNLKTPDTFLAFGKTLRQLTAEIRALGLQQSDIDKYVEKWACKNVDGVFVQQLAPNRQLFKSAGGTSEITFSDTAFTLKSNGSIVLAAGYLPDDPTLRFMEWKSGVNTLRIESSGNALGMDKLMLNGVVLLTTTTLRAYQSQGNADNTDPDDNKLWIEGRNGLAFTGKGSKADPIKGTLTPPTATTTTKGVARLKSGPGTETSGVAATPDSLTPYEGKTGTYVAKSSMLNSKAMDDGQRTMTKADLQLGNVDNTRDVDKPISVAQQFELDALSLKGHKHDWSELDIVPATSSTYGAARFTNTVDGVGGAKAVTPNLLKQLSDRLDIIATATMNNRPGQTTDFSAIDDSTWTITATKKGLTVKDLRYFYLLNGERGEGVANGTIDLQTTPMFNWFSPNNVLENTWPAGVQSSGLATSMNGITPPPPLTLQPQVLSVTAAARGTTAGVPMITKTRVRICSGKLKMYVSGGGPVTVYLDGAQLIAGAAPLYVEADVDPTQDTHCIGILSNCNNTSRAAGITYEIFDGNAPVARSEVGNPITQLQDFVTNPEGMRHYLYLNMATGSLFSRAEPILSEGIDIERAFIGYIDVPVGGLVGSSVSFEKMTDFGSSKELATHIVRKDAHVPLRGDWRFSDNSSMLPLGKLQLAVQLAVYSDRDTEINPNRWYANLSRQDTNPLIALYAVDNQSPAFWRTPYNPKENGNPTFEGSLLAEHQLPYPNLPSQPELLFVAPRTGASSSYYRLKYLKLKADDSIEIGFAKGIAVQTFYQKTLPTFAGVTPSYTKTVVRQADITDASALDYPTLKNSMPRQHIRYRYNLKTRVLRVFKLYYDGVADVIKLTELEYQFNFDASLFMGGFVGLVIPANTPYTQIKMLPTLMDISASGFDANKYHYFRSLFESYVDNAVSRWATPLMPRTAYGSSSLQPNTTEFISLPCEEGSVEISHVGQLPTMFWEQAINVGSPGLDNVSPTDWRASVDGSGTKAILNTPLALKLQSTKNTPVTSITLDVRCNHDVFLGSGAYGDGLTVTADPTTVQTINMSVSGVASRSVLNAYLYFLPKPLGIREPLVCEYTVTFNYNGGITESFTHNTPATLRFAGLRYILPRNSDFHMTQRVWEYLTAQMDAERQQDGTDFGHWV